VHELRRIKATSSTRLVWLVEVGDGAMVTEGVGELPAQRWLSSLSSRLRS